MFAVYNFSDGNHNELIVLDVTSDLMSDFIEAIKLAEYPVPSNGTQVLFIENDSVVDCKEFGEEDE